MKSAKLLVVALMASSLGACCNCLKELPPTGVLPPPISLQQQLDLLNARAIALPRFRAYAEPNGVEILQQEANGKTYHRTADGQLMLQQDYAEHSAQFKLVVQVLSQDIFVLGRNDSAWWAYNRDQHDARVGPVMAHPELATPKEATSAGALALVADFVPQLLGVTEIAPESDEIITMRVDDVKGVNDLILQKVHDDGTASMEREIVVDRRSGEIRKVSLFTADGELLVTAQLGNYEPVTYRGSAKPGDGGVPSFPHAIVLQWPAGRGQLGLRIREVVVVPPFPPQVFALPDWNDLGINPENVR